MMIVRTLKKVRHDGKLYALGETLKLEDSQTIQRLITLGAVISEGVSENHETLVETNTSNENLVDVPLDDEDDLTDEEVFAMIEKNFTLDEIKKELSNIDLKLPKSTKTKDDIIQFIIAKEMDEHFLDLITE